jgi:hypothetical protein
MSSLDSFTDQKYLNLEIFHSSYAHLVFIRLPTIEIQRERRLDWRTIDLMTDGFTRARNI